MNYHNFATVSFPQPRLLPSQLRGFSRFVWHLYAYTVALGLFLFLTGGIGLLYGVSLFDKLKYLFPKTSINTMKKPWGLSIYKVNQSP